MIGQILGSTSKQLDDFFETKDYNYLLPSEPANKEKKVSNSMKFFKWLKERFKFIIYPTDLKGGFKFNITFKF